MYIKQTLILGMYRIEKVHLIMDEGSNLQQKLAIRKDHNLLTRLATSVSMYERTSVQDVNRKFIREKLWWLKDSWQG